MAGVNGAVEAGGALEGYFGNQLAQLVQLSLGVLGVGVVRTQFLEQNGVSFLKVFLGLGQILLVFVDISYVAVSGGHRRMIRMNLIISGMIQPMPS